MTIGEKLLNLSTEYQEAVKLREDFSQQFGDDLAGRKPDEIAAEYETVLRSLTAGAER